MQPSKSLQSLFYFFLLLPLALCVTKRKAYVVVKNNTPHSVSGIGLSHKYSDVYKEKCTWQTLQPGEVSSRCEVFYNTGFGTTGRDWWYVFGHNDLDPIGTNSMSQWYSNPDNFRAFFDTLEEIAPFLISGALKAAGFVNPSLKPVAEVAKVVADALCQAMLNDAKTAGYKQHILRSEDAGKITTISVNNDGTINFLSPSGRSNTVYSTGTVNFGL
jgi:hypothetical protein